MNFAQARPQVEAAWRLERARTLAREKAEELAKQARETHGDYLPVLTEASKRYGNVFDLNGVARWVKPPLTSRADFRATYQPYAVPDDKIEYPSAWPDFVDTAKEAVAKNVVEPGKGWYHRPSRGPRPVGASRSSRRFCGRHPVMV